MLSFNRAKFRKLVVYLAALLWGVAQAQQQQSPRLSGTVEDPTGARVPLAEISVDGEGLHFETRTGRDGAFSVAVPAGEYEVTVDASGFNRTVIEVGRQQAIGGPALSVRLSIATHREIVDVGQNAGLSTAASENLNSIVLRREDLSALSSDEGTFQKQLLAMTGVGSGSAQIYVDGFSNGRIPPKSAIQSVRINRDPYAAQYDTLGFNRVEIDSRAGSDKLHGGGSLAGSQQALNSANPFAPSPQPGYYILNADGNLSGPLGHGSTFYVGGFYNDQQNNTSVNALLPTLYSAAVPDPQTTSGASLRLDHEFSERSRLRFRYQFDQSTMQNGGVGQLVLPSQGFANTADAHTFQITHDFVPNAHTVNQLRGQYIHTTADQHPEQLGVGPCTDPLFASCSVYVQGAFAGGGDPTQFQVDTRDNVEAEDIFSMDRKQHFFRLGARYRFTRDANTSTAGFNGQFVFSSLAQYNLGQPAQFSLITGAPLAVTTLEEVAGYAQDEWRARPDLTIDLGLRVEGQSGIDDHLNPSPRAGMAWAPHRGKSKTPVFIVRGGFGIFFDRFLIDYLTTAAHQNGVNQQTSYVTDAGTLYTLYNQGFNPASVPSAEATVYRVDPNLRTSYNISQSAAIERRLGRYGSVGATYLYVRGVHQYESINANAPLPGTGARPLGGMSNVYQYSSHGIEKDTIGFVNLKLTPSPRVLGFVQYALSSRDSSGQGAATFASNSYNVNQDYGRLPTAQRQQFSAFFSATLPYALALTGYVTAQSGLPFNITTGADNNGDTIYNDRPSFATSASPAGAVVATRYGTFDLTPQPGERIVPINYGTGPGLLWTSASLSRSFDFGGRMIAGAKGLPARHEGGWQMSLSVEADNVSNHRNAAPVDGVLSSPLFGKALSQWTGILTSTAGSRIVFLRTNLTF